MSTQPSMFSRLRDDEQGADWKAFCDRYVPLVRRVAVAHGLSDDDACETVQEVMLRLVRGMDDFQYDRTRGQFRNFLYTVTMNVVRTQLLAMTRAHGTLTADAVPDESEPYDVWEREWQANELRRALQEMSEDVDAKTFQAFQLFALEEWPAEKVAAFLDISRESVYQAKSRMLKRLRSYLCDIEEPEP